MDTEKNTSRERDLGLFQGRRLNKDLPLKLFQERRKIERMLMLKAVIEKQEEEVQG